MMQTLISRHSALALSPLRSNMIALPPTFIQVGSEEILLDDSKILAARMEADGVPIHSQLWQGMRMFGLLLAMLCPKRLYRLQLSESFAANSWLENIE